MNTHARCVPIQGVLLSEDAAFVVYEDRPEAASTSKWGGPAMEL